MKYLDYFSQKQKIAYKSLLNSFQNNKKSHVFLISGEKGSMLKETSLLIAKSFICNEHVMCCEECNDCKRVENGSYTDLLFINKEEKNITVDQIENLQKEFSMAALEPKGIKVYIIHLIENGSDIVSNKLLKFIEEPEPNIYGIITTQNISKVLPTIISRCQLIKLVEDDKTILKNELIKNSLSEEDAYLLSKFNNSEEDCMNYYNSSSYQSVKDLVVDTLEYLSNRNDDLIYFAQSKIYPLTKDKKTIKLYLELLNLYLMDILTGYINHVAPTNIEFNDKKYLEFVLTKVILALGKIDSVLNINLVLDKLFYEITYKIGG